MFMLALTGKKFQDNRLMTELNCPLRFTKPVHHHNAYEPHFLSTSQDKENYLDSFFE